MVLRIVGFSITVPRLCLLSRSTSCIPAVVRYSTSYVHVVVAQLACAARNIKVIDERSSK